MKKIISLFLIITILTCGICISANAAGVETGEFGNTMHITHINWNKVEYNALHLITPGEVLNYSSYYIRIHARYEAASGGYTVVSKADSHETGYQQTTVDSGCIGLALEYNIYSFREGAEISRQNFLVMQQIRPGDVLTLNGVDVANKTINVSGTYGQNDFISNATVTVKFNSSFNTVTAFSNKRIVTYGDSLTANGGWSERLGDAIGTNIINSGLSGISVEDLNNSGRIQKYVSAYNPDIIMLMAGMNNAGSTVVAGTFEAKYRSLITNLQNATSARIILMTVSGANVDKSLSSYNNQLAVINPIVRSLANEYGFDLIDIAAAFEGKNNNTYMLDALHPNTAGYKIYSDTMINALKAIESKYSECSSAYFEMIGKSYVSNLYTAVAKTPGTTVSTANSDISSALGASISIKNGTSTPSGASIVSTGMSFVKGDITYKIIVKSDVSCDGSVNISDAQLTYSFIMNKQSLSDVQQEAALCNLKSTEVSILHVLAILNSI